MALYMQDNIISSIELEMAKYAEETAVSARSAGRYPAGERLCL
jgi:hypothetical protein